MKEPSKLEVRKYLTAYPASQQLSFDSFESKSALLEKDQMAYGTMPKRMDRLQYTITNKNLLNRKRMGELLDIMSQIVIEFEGPTEISQMFQKMGIDTRANNIWEMYLEKSNLLCNYCLQVNLSNDAPFFLRVQAFAK